MAGPLFIECFYKKANLDFRLKRKGSLAKLLPSFENHAKKNKNIPEHVDSFLEEKGNAPQSILYTLYHEPVWYLTLTWPPQWCHFILFVQLHAYLMKSATAKYVNIVLEISRYEILK